MSTNIYFIGYLITIRGLSNNPIRGIVFDLRNVNQIFGVSLKIYCIKEKLAFVSRRWFSFVLLNFVESFPITWRTLFKIVFTITVMANVSIGGTFTTVVEFWQIAFYNYVFGWSRGLTSRFWMFWILCRSMISFDFRIALAYLRVSSVVWLDITLGRVNLDPRRRLSQIVIICATKNHILY